MTSTSGIGSSTSAAGNNAAGSNITATLGKYEFLKILAAELTNQDPTDPLDNKDFIAQMAQFSTLEQMQNMSDAFSSLKESFDKYLTGQSSGSGNTLVTQAAGLIGRNVTAEVDGSEFEGAVEAVQIKDSILYAVIGGEPVPLSSITSISAGTADTGESGGSSV